MCKSCLCNVFGLVNIPVRTLLYSCSHTIAIPVRTCSYSCSHTIRLNNIPVRTPSCSCSHTSFTLSYVFLLSLLSWSLNLLYSCSHTIVVIQLVLKLVCGAYLFLYVKFPLLFHIQNYGLRYDDHF